MLQTIRISRRSSRCVTSSTTGLPAHVIYEIVTRVHDVAQGRGLDFSRHKIKLYRQVVISLMLLRQNISQMVIADMFGVSQSTICRIWRRITEILETVLVFTSGGVEEAIAQGQLLLVDGTYVPTGNRPASGQGAANYSGKRKVQCVNIQIAATCRGDLVAVSEPFPGARHDARVIQECGWSDLFSETEATWVADSAYTGVLWVLWTLLKNGISRLLSGVGSILGGRGWVCGTLTPSEVVSDCSSCSIQAVTSFMACFRVG